MSPSPIGAVIVGMTRFRASALLIVLALVAAACTNGDDDAATTTTVADEPATTVATDDGAEPDDTTEPETEPAPVDALAAGLEAATFVDGDCFSEVPGLDARCGTVTVPMDWDTGEGEVVLPVVVLPATGAGGGVPVVYLEGGPGGHALETLPLQYGSLFEAINVDRDVIVFDQRGAGFTEPSLGCAAIDELTAELRADADVTPEDELVRVLDVFDQCVVDWQAAGADLTEYHSVNSAHDAEAIRLALGIEQWDLFGISYGTRLAQEILRQHDGGVRAVVLDSVLPSDGDFVAEGPQGFIDSLENVDAACAAEAECAATGDLTDRLRAAYAQLEAEPLELEVLDPFDPFAAPTAVAFDGDTLAGTVFGALYSPVQFGDLPELLTDLESGGSDAALAYSTISVANSGFVTPGMLWTVLCHETVPFVDLDAVVLPPDPFGDRPDSGYLFSNNGPAALEFCERIPTGTAEDSIFAPVSSDLPTLVMAGTFDPVTPVAWSERIAETFPNAQVVEVLDQGHAVAASDCGQDLLVAFLDAPGPVDADCADDRTPRFLASGSTELSFVPFDVFVPDFMANVAGVHPEGWTVDPTGIQATRLDGLLDPTTVVQLGLPTAFTGLVEDQLLGQFELTLDAGESTVESTQGAWRRRTADDGEVAMIWYDREVDDTVSAVVILIATSDEVGELAPQVESAILDASVVTGG